MYGGWFPQTTTIRWLRFICGKMTQARGTAIYQQEGAEAGASGDDLGAPLSLSALSKSALTHHLQAGGGTACGSRALSEGDQPGVPSLPGDRPADATGGLGIGRSCADALGAWGPWATNKLRRVYTGYCLPLLSAPINEN